MTQTHTVQLNMRNGKKPTRAKTCLVIEFAYSLCRENLVQPEPGALN